MTKDQIINLVIENKIEKAFQTLENIPRIKNGYAGDLLSLKLRYNRLKQEERKGVIKQEDLDRLKNEINHSLIEIIDTAFYLSNDNNQQTTFPESSAQKALTNSRNKYRYPIRYLLIRLLRDLIKNAFFWVLIIALIFTFLEFSDNLVFKNLGKYSKYYFQGTILIGFISLIYSRFRKIARSVPPSIKLKTSYNSPIKGLRAFDFDDAEIFQSLQREDEIRICSNGIQQDDFRFGLLTGKSGCGKTSFIRAGLYADLKKNGLECVVVKLTNEPPIESIKKAIQDQVLEIEKIHTEKELFEILNEVLEKSPYRSFVLVLDQFEQFFTYYKTAEDRLDFIQQLDRCYKTLSKVKFLIALRGDFTEDLHEIQAILDYPLRAQYNYFKLKRFSSNQAAAIFKIMANVENIDYDDIFIESMCQEELASKEDGLISAVDIQIISFIIKGQQESEKAFTQIAFQKLGGIDGLLERFLRDQLETPNYYNTDQAALKVLLAFIDLENNVRAGELTQKELNQKLTDSRIAPLLPAILSWLEDLRLINKTVNADNQYTYELAHERLILPLASVSGRTLGEVEKANQILNRRTNEWLANDKRNKFLPNWQEHWLIWKQQKSQRIKWGSNKEWKEKLLAASYKRNLWQTSLAGLSMLIIAIVFSFQSLETYRYNQKIPASLKELIINSLDRKEQSLILDSLSSFDNLQYVLTLTDNLIVERVKDKGYLSIIAAGTDKILKDSLSTIPDVLFEADKKILYPISRTKALIYLALASKQIGDSTSYNTFLDQSIKLMEADKMEEASFVDVDDMLKVIKKIEEPRLLVATIELVKKIKIHWELKDELIQSLVYIAMDQKDSFFIDKAIISIRARKLKTNIISVLARKAASEKDSSLLKRTLKQANRIANVGYRSDAFLHIAEAANQFMTPSFSRRVINMALLTATDVMEPESKSRRLTRFALGALKIGGKDLAAPFLGEALKATAQISDSRRRLTNLDSVVTSAIKVGKGVNVGGILDMYQAFSSVVYQFSRLKNVGILAKKLGQEEIIQERMDQLLRICEEEQNKAYGYGSLIQLAELAGQIEDLSTVKRCIELGGELKNGNQIMVNLSLSAAQARDTTLAKQTLRKALGNINIDIDNFGRQLNFYMNILKAAITIGDLHLFEDVLRKDLGQSEEFFSYNDTKNAFKSIADAIVSIDGPVSPELYFDLSLEAIRRMNYLPYEAWAFLYISEAALKKNVNRMALRALKESKEAIKMVDHPASKCGMLYKMAEISMNMQDTIEAISFLKEASEEGKKIDVENNNLGYLNFLVDEAARLKDTTLARICIDKVLEKIKSIEEANAKSSKLAQIVRRAMDLKYPQILNKIYDEVSFINGYEFRAVTLEALIAGYLYFGRYKKAHDLAEAMPLTNIMKKAQAFLNLKKAWIEKENFKPITTLEVGVATNIE